MTLEQKEFLLKDLCARLPYGVKACVYSYWNESYLDDSIVGVDIEEDEFFCSIVPGVRCPIIKTKPYLFPLSSMTEEQEEEFKKLYYRFHESAFIFNERFSYDRYSIKDIGFYPCYLQDWLDKNYFDYRGLIPMGLAIDCTNLNIY